MRSGYRKGAVLGLTIAEIFILLLFLILLTALALGNQWNEEKKQYENELAVLKNEIKHATFITPKEIETLRSRVNSAERERDLYWDDLLRKNQRLEETKKTLKNINAQVEVVEEERDRYKKELVQNKQRIEEINKVLDELLIEKFQEKQDLEQILNDIRESNNLAELERDRYSEELAQERQLVSKLREELDQSQYRLEDAVADLNDVRESNNLAEMERDLYSEELMQERQLVSKLRKELDQSQYRLEDAVADLSILRRKGENPPCWYETLQINEGKTREKPHYLLNVAVFDKGFVIAPRPAPPGGALDDNGSLYAEEARLLGVAELPYGKTLSDTDFTNTLRPLYEQGKQSKIRTYSCVFFVRVWDKTSPGSKARWKHAHDRILEGMFGTYDCTRRSMAWHSVI